MKETFSRPIRKKEIIKEIDDGIQEYLREKISKSRGEKEIINYNEVVSDRPFNREEFEKSVNNFLELNFELLSLIVLGGENVNKLKAFKILNKDLRGFGFQNASVIVEAFLSRYSGRGDFYAINKEVRDYDNRSFLYSDSLALPEGAISESNLEKFSEFNYDLLEREDLRVGFSGGVGQGRDMYVNVSEILATSYLKDNIKIDSKLDAGNNSSNYLQRYFYKEAGRYLCENDFGMKPFGDQANVSDITPFAQSVQRHIRMVLNNIETVKNAVIDESEGESYFTDLEHSLGQEYRLPEWPHNSNPDYQEIITKISEIRSIINEKIKRVKQKKLYQAINSEEVKNVILEAIPFAKFANEIGSRKNEEIEKIIVQDLGEEADLYKRLEYFKSNEFRGAIKDLIIKDSYVLPEIGDKRVATSVAHNRPVILQEDRIQSLIDNAGDSYIKKTQNDIINSDPDEDLKKIVRNTTSGRGPNSPYHFCEFDFYEALKKIGSSKYLEMYPAAKEQIFEQAGVITDTEINKFIDDIDGVYKIFGNKIRQMEADKIKKEMWHSGSLEDSGIWDYFAQRALGEKPPVFDRNNYDESNQLMAEYRGRVQDFWENLPQSERRKLFFEGKKMYWLAKQINGKAWEISRNRHMQEHEQYQEEDYNKFKFHEHFRSVNWEQYDCRDIDTDKLTKYINTHGGIICAFLVSEDDSMKIASDINLETIMHIIGAIEAGVDMRGVALAFDKKKHLEGLLSGKEQKNDLEYALKDWPKELRDRISPEEFQMYFENAEQYLYQDPSGMIRYSHLLEKEPQIRDILGNKVDKKSDLDLRLSLSVQTPEVRAWYFEGAEYVGHSALQKYFIRFQATREQSGGYPNLHDALYWIPNIKRVEVGEARALLDDVTTVDDSNELRSFLSRYKKDGDLLKGEGPIKSLRELKKRVFALEANIDLSTFSPEIINIISAPGFSISCLKDLQNEQRFIDLTEGKLDQEQPFKSHKRKFTATPLHELLKVGLGSFKEKIRGTAQDPKGLFNDLRKLINGKEINGKAMQVQDLLREVPVDIEEDVLSILQNQRVAIGPILEATVHDKSDPEGWVCGNYTDCCMPFGDSKNNNYMFNRGAQYFTIKYNGRIIAQSVVVDSIDKRSKEDVIILDNIEVANNYKNQSAMLSRIYKIFWAEYTSKKVKIGTGYSDLIPDGAKLESNNYAPKLPLSYSDATGYQIYDLPKIRGVESLDKVLTFANLTERDAEIIAEMEKEAYPEGLVQGKGQALEIIRKQRELDLPGAASSFILRQGNEPAGYLLVLPEESRINSGESVAHIHDMAVLPKFQGGIISRKIMERMLDVAKAYNVPAIEFEARESTSYRLLTNPRIAKWIEERGYKLVYNEPLPEYLGGEDFYYVRLERVEE
jgi:GNAT superfamily N-acetyltransferase